MRKEVSEFVKELQKDGIKISYAKVARQFNCDYRTVKRYCEEEQTEKKPRKAKVSKLDPFKSMIEEKVDACCSYNSIYLMLRKRGYSGKYSILANYCKRHHDAQTRKATIRFETTPGLQGQVDWKEDMTLHTRSGEAMYSKFESLINEMQTFNFNNFKQTNPLKCKNCIYEPLCSFSTQEG